MSDAPEDNGNGSAREELEEAPSGGPKPPQPGSPGYSRKVLQFVGGRFLLRSNGRVHVLPRRLSRQLNLPEEVEVVDPRFLRYSHSYLIQALLATIAMLLILLFVDSIADAALAAGLGSSVVILFLHPSASAARPRSVIGGHGLALVIGVGASVLVFSSPAGELIAGTRVFSDLSLAFSVGAVILIMAITNTEHPPAAGTVLGLSLQPLEPVRIVVFIIAVILLALIQHYLRSHLQDLM